MSQVFPVNDSQRFSIATATAGQSAFSILFPFLANDDITVEKTSIDGVKSTLTRPTHYTLAGAGNPTGGTMTLKAAYLAKAGEQYAIYGRAVLTRAQSITRGGKYSSAATDEDFDRLTLIAQEARRDIDRSLKVPFGGTPPSLTIGAAGTVPVWTAGGDLAEGPSAAAIDAIEAALGVEAGRALVHGEEMGEPYDAGNRRIIGLADGSESTDAVTKGQLDAVIGDIDPETLTDRVTALEEFVAQAFVPGDIKLTTRKYTTDPAGWLRLHATRTIGDAGSGGTALAGAAAEACFVAVWTDYSNDDCPIYDSAGNVTTRGASAAADFAAGKRLTLPAPEGRFARLASAGKPTGTREANQNKSHAHTASFAGNALPPHQHQYYSGNQEQDGAFVNSNSNGPWQTLYTNSVSAGTPTGTVTVNSDGGDEARPDSFVFMGLIKL